ncbi:hypothetical protein GCM10027615_67130 [Plantactinospora veratri]
MDRDTLPPHHEAEIPLVLGDALGGLPLGNSDGGLPIRVQVNNRKILEGFYRGLGLADPLAALRAVDRLDRIGPDRVAALLAETAGATEAQAKACLALTEIATPDPSFADAVRGLGVTDPLLDEGLTELVAVMENAVAHAPGSASPTCASPGVWTTTRVRSTRPSCAGTSGSGRSAPAAGTTTWPATPTPASRGWASRSGSPGCSGCSSARRR